MIRWLSGSKWRRIKNRETWSHFKSYALLIGPSAFVARLMGFLSCKFESSRIVFWKLHFVYATIITAVSTISMIYSAYELNVSYIFRDAANMWQTNIIMLMSVIIFITAYASNRSMNAAIQRVSDISRVVPLKTFCRLTKIVYVKDLTLIAPMLIFIPTLIRYYNKLSFYLIFYMFIGVFTLDNLYMNNVYVLSACFQQINESLEKVKEILINDEPHLLRRVFHEQKNPMLLTILRNQKKQHLETSRIVNELNNAFSMQLEATLFLFLIDITFNIYTYLVIYRDEGMIEKFGYDIVFVFLNAVHLVVIIVFVDIAKCEMAKIGWNIHKILIHTLDEKVTTELEMFSLQVLQRGNTFTMKGIILDFTYLTQIVCGVSTFLLILIQFSIGKPC